MKTRSRMAYKFHEKELNGDKGKLKGDRGALKFKYDALKSYKEALNVTGKQEYIKERLKCFFCDRGALLKACINDISKMLNFCHFIYAN